MKLVGIVGSNSTKSYNRMLMKYIAVHFDNIAELEILDTNDVPLFNQSNNQTNSDAIQFLNKKILAADGVIIATPEHNHTVPANLKSLIEWLSFDIHPFEKKPVMIIGASYFGQGTSRAQLHLRQILEAPGVNALTLPGNEFLLANVRGSFDEHGDLKDERTSDFLKSTLEKFVKFVSVIKALDDVEDVSADEKVTESPAEEDEIDAMASVSLDDEEETTPATKEVEDDGTASVSIDDEEVEEKPVETNSTEKATEDDATASASLDF